MLDMHVRRTTRVAGAVTAIGAVVIGVFTAAFEFTDTINVIGVVLGASLLLCALAWLFSAQTPRFLPTATTGIGMALVVGAPLLTRRGDEDVLVAWIVHILVGLIVAATGVWAGKKLRTPRVDHM